MRADATAARAAMTETGPRTGETVTVVAAPEGATPVAATLLPVVVTGTVRAPALPVRVASVVATVMVRGPALRARVASVVATVMVRAPALRARVAS
ncbi:hypothetical protein, partial [Micromonospora sp. DT201]|uniref:hypothetical protein n=1 Tax=Micromonospora sp. DT201 TaxID=3393442 RepID=UPI003CE90B0A